MNAESHRPTEVAAHFAWPELVGGCLRETFAETILPEYLPSRRWFGGKARVRRGYRVAEELTFSEMAAAARMLFVCVEYAEGPAETYALPLQTAAGAEARRIAEDSPRAAVAWFRAGSEETLLYDAIYDEAFRATLLRAIVRAQSIVGRAGQLHGVVARGATWVAGSRVLEVEQSNSSILYGGRYFLKLYRRVEDGLNPDAELTRFLSERQHFAQIPEFAGSIEYRRFTGPASVLALLVAQVPNDGDAWAGTLSELHDFCGRMLAAPPSAVAPVGPGLFGSGAAADEFASLPGEAAAGRARLLGQRTAELHLALAGEAADPAFAPEPFTAQDWRSLHAALGASVRTGLAALRRQVPALPESARPEAEKLIGREGDILARYDRLLERPIRAAKTRIHGDYHLGQVLQTGEDYVILDFEGEPARPLAERRLKASPLRDVAGMIRSFGYAARTALDASEPNEAVFLAPWLRAWERSVRRLFLDAYRVTAGAAPFLPDRPEDSGSLLEAFLFDKAIYEVGYELNNRPDWLPIPVSAILELLTATERT